MIKGRYGYINAEGKVVIQPQFTSANRFHDGLALVGVDGENISDTPGNYDYIMGKKGYIDQSGKFVIAPGKFEYPQDFSEGLASVCVNDLDVDKCYGYINTAGKVVIDPKFRHGGEFLNGTAEIRMADYKYGLIDKTGKFIILPKYDDILPISEGIVIAHTILIKRSSLSDVQLSDLATVFLDINGQILTRPKLLVFGMFEEGLVLAITEKGQGFVNKSGEVVIEPQFEKALGFSEGLSPVRVNKKWGYINRTGKFIIPLQFDLAYRFSDGLARIGTSRKHTAFIDKTGSIALEVEGWEVFDFEDGIAYARKDDGTTGYINKDGKFIWQGK